MTPQEIKQITQQLGIDKPIMKTQLTDNRLKIYLYGGQVIEHVIQAAPPNLKPELLHLLENPESFNRSELRILAQELGIDGALEMNKRPLVAAIGRWKREHMQQ